MESPSMARMNDAPQTPNRRQRIWLIRALGKDKKPNLADTVTGWVVLTIGFFLFLEWSPILFSYFDFLIPEEKSNNNIIQESGIRVLFYSAVAASAIIGMWLAAVRNDYTDRQLEQQGKQIELQVQQRNNEDFKQAVDLLNKTDNHMSQDAGLRLFARLVKDNTNDIALVTQVLRTLQSYLEGYTKQAQDRESRSNMIMSSTMALHLIHNIVDSDLDLGIKDKTEELFYKNFADKDLSFMDFVQEIPNLELPFTTNGHPKLDLTKANFEGADLQEANLKGADLQGAKIGEAKNLETAHLDGADLRGSTIGKAHNLQSAHLQGADLRGIRFRDTDFMKAELQGAKLQGAKFFFSPDTRKMEGAKVEDANFWEAEYYQSIDDLDKGVNGDRVKRDWLETEQGATADDWDKVWRYDNPPPEEEKQ